MSNDLRTGYNENFLGDDFTVPMPKFNLELQDDILKREELRDEYIADYIHYSIVMSRSNKQAVYSAANVDQKEEQKAKGRRWFVDPRIGADNQIGPVAYKNNPWDRGHLTRRTAITWGTPYLARRASNDSCSYANASLQHANFNQDEWRLPEEAVARFDKDKNDKLCVFTGPLFTDFDRWYARPGIHERFRIPSAFWKVIVYIGKESNNVECQAFLMYQDNLFLADKRGRDTIELKNYQVTITEIENVTGLEFPEELFHANPLYYFPRENVNKGPEAYVMKEAEDGLVFDRGDTDKFELRDLHIGEEIPEVNPLLREPAPQEGGSGSSPTPTPTPSGDD